MSRNFSGSVWQAVEGSLFKRFESRIYITHVQPFWPSRVFRCSLQSSDGTSPATVIVRLPREGTDGRSERVLLDNERAALEYLTATGSAFTPRFLAGGAKAEFLVSEDMGTASSLLDRLLGNDAEAAAQGALAFARGLGRMHAQTAGKSVLGGRPVRLPHLPLSVAEHWQQVQKAVTQLALPQNRAGVERDVASVVRILAEPGQYLALSSGDPSVVNCQITSSGVRFFDFERACFRHTFLDAIVLRFFYPTGGPAWYVPHRVSLPIEAAYRAELAQACPDITEDVVYEGGMAAASAAWMIVRMARLLRVDAGPDEEPWLLLPPGWSKPPPKRSRRRQFVSILETYTASAKQAHTLSALTAWCEDMINALRIRWPEAAGELPLYPAFRRI